MGNISHTVGGNANLVSFKSAARAPITFLKTSFLPKQDLHGYSKPWIGGTGKNLLQNTRTVGEITVHTAIFTTNYDGSITIKGNPTNASGLTINKTVTLPAGTYILTGCPSGGGADTFSLIAGTVYDYGSGSTFTLNVETTLKVTISWVANASLDGLTFYPMIRLASNNDATWEPYENICLIEGWNQCETYQSTRNIADKSNYCLGISASWGAVEKTYGMFGSNTTRVQFLFHVPPGSTVTMKCHNSDLYWVDRIIPVKYDSVIMQANVTNAFLGYYNIALYTNVSQKLTTKTYTMPSDSDALLIRARMIEDNVDMTQELFDKLQFSCVIGSTALENYEKASSITLPVIFPTLGKNLLNSNSNNIINLSNGSGLNYTYENGILSTTGSTLIGFKVPCIPSTQYTFSFNSSYIGSYMMARIYSYENEPNEIDNDKKVVQVTDNTVSFITGNNIYWLICAIVFSSSAPEATVSNIQLEYGDTATTYEPYDSNNTVYGGYIDPVKGELIATYGIINTTWGGYNQAYDNINGGNIVLGNYERRIFTFDTRFKPAASCEGFSNIKDELDANATYNVDSLFFNMGNTMAIVKLPVGTDEDTVLQFCGLLSTPITYKLPPIQLKTLLDQNNIWSNTNENTEVSYAIHDSAMIRSSKKRIIANEPHIEAASGTIATFNTDMAAPLKECKIYFNPIQEGSGDPSPSNIRTITGWNNIIYNLSNNSTNLVNLQDNKAVSAYGFNLIVEDQGRHITLTGTGSTTRRINLCSVPYITQPFYVNGFPILKDELWSVYRDNALIEEAHDINGHIYQHNEGDTYIRFGFNLITDHYYDIDVYPIFTTYAPITLDWTSTAGTLYGGYVDLISGELVQEWILQEPNNNTWTVIGNNCFQVGHTACNVGNVEYNKNNILCTHNIWNANKYIMVNSAGQFMIHASFFTDQGITTVNNTTIQNYLDEQKQNNTSLQVCSKLVTPIHYQLTPIQLKSLIGPNNIWSNANGPVEISYWTH